MESKDVIFDKVDNKNIMNSDEESNIIYHMKHRNYFYLIGTVFLLILAGSIAYGLYRYKLNTYEVVDCTIVSYDTEWNMNGNIKICLPYPLVNYRYCGKNYYNKKVLLPELDSYNDGYQYNNYTDSNNIDCMNKIASYYIGDNIKYCFLTINDKDPECVCSNHDRKNRDDRQSSCCYYGHKYIDFVGFTILGSIGIIGLIVLLILSITEFFQQK